MSSLRRRFRSTTGLLLAVQLGVTGLAIATWSGVLRYTAREQEVSQWRAEVQALGDAVRERYVHEAHTFIAGGPGHLDHLASVDATIDARLARVSALPLPDGVQAELGRLRTDLERDRGFFRAEVEPAAREGALDRASASRLHDLAEVLAADLAADVARVGAALDEVQEAERAAVAAATRRAWLATSALAMGGVLLAFVLTWRLGQAVLGPLDALRGAAAAFGEERPAAAPEGGDEELAAVSRAFNLATAQARAAQSARLGAERLAALGEMSAAVAHELLNPLTVILGHPKVRADADLAPVREEAEHAVGVVRGLLGFARPGEEPAGPVDLARLVREAAARAEADADVRVRVETPAEVVAAGGALRQVLDNLVRNAVQASADVEVALLPGPTIEVLDRGPGIPKGLRDRLYEPFATGRATGTGLGLAVCQRIVRASGGTLEHLDRAGGGTVARWRLRA